MDSFDNGSDNREIKAALAFMQKKCQFQLRKGTSIPYYTHPQNVESLVASHALIDPAPVSNLVEPPSKAFPDGITLKDVRIAALLHDLIEDYDNKDSKGRTTEQVIREKFGETVVRLVLYCSDIKREENQHLPYNERKRKYLKRIAEDAPKVVTLIKLCDMMDNVRLGISTYLSRGEEYWKDFNTTKEEKLRYYHDAIEIFTASGNYPAVVEEFHGLLDQFEQVIKDHNQPPWKSKILSAKKNFAEACKLIGDELRDGLKDTLHLNAHRRPKTQTPR
jgi:(p)ppGpp synthase/HD superfamily hydrolase